MDINDIIVDAPAWKWVIALLFTLGLTLVRYYGEKKWALGVVRLVVLATLCFLLLEPLLRSTSSEIEPSTMVLLIDESASQVVGNDSLKRKSVLRVWAQEGAPNFESLGYNVEVFGFAKSVTSREATDTAWHFRGNRTNLSSALEAVSSKYAHRNVAGVVVTTDGLSNSGRDPEFGAELLDVPHFFIGSGDTTVVQDVEITSFACNQVTYLNNEFPVEVKIRSNGFVGESIKLKVYLGSQIVESETIRITDKKGFFTKHFYLNATESGMKRVKVAITPLEGEQRRENNYASEYVEVLDSKRNITLIAHAPHPDLNAISLALESNLHQEVSIIYASDIKSNTDFSETDVAILHNIPHSLAPTQQAITTLINSDTPILFIGGPQMNWGELPVDRSGVTVEVGKAAQAINGKVKKGFSLFKLPEGLSNDLKFLPPLTKAMGKVKPSSSLNTAINVSLDALETEWPLLAFNKDAMGRRSGIVVGEGMWRWRMESTLHSGNSQVFDALLCSTVQYLDSRDDVRRFRVKSNKRFEDSDRVIFSAQVYDASLNSTTDSDISLVISNAQGENFDYDFSVDNDSYKLDCGRMPAGEYTWVAKTIVDGKIEKLSGGFVVSEVIAEFISESANHDLLKRLALKTGGEFLCSINTEEIDVESLTLEVDSKVNKRDVIHEFTDRLELINFRLILSLILGGLTLEWVIRRRQGGY